MHDLDEGLGIPNWTLFGVSKLFFNKLLGEHIPRALAEKLASIRRMLQEAMREIEAEVPEGDLAAELSEDADEESARPATTGGGQSLG